MDRNYKIEDFECSIEAKHLARFEEYTSLGLMELGCPVPGVHLQHYEFDKSLVRFTSIPYFRFKIMSYNILAQTYIEKNLQNSYYYKQCPSRCLEWDYRRGILQSEILFESPDIICLQEVEANEKVREELFRPFKEQGYIVLYVERGLGMPDGCAILYRDSRFKLKEFSPVLYQCLKLQLLSYPNVGMVVKLELKDFPGYCVVVANTHLLQNPHLVDVKLCQLMVLLAEMERIASYGTDKYHPVILTGDLNVSEYSGLISLLRNGHADCNHILSCHSRNIFTPLGESLAVPNGILRKYFNIRSSCKVHKSAALSQEPKDAKKIENKSAQGRGMKLIPPLDDTCRWCLNHPFNFEDVYQFAFKACGGLENWFERRKSVKDYIFYSGGRKQLQLVSRLHYPSWLDYKYYFPYLPNQFCASDHLPLTASFIYPIH
ncbi:protein angel homolog 2-like isoform X1 [Homalodisca vitripennis]|uniref:protein angel homolog 2-like isoform X1 n=1 Tax=Homalodisca vitripennis TaxID=197043 RepID=UPI001EEAA14F|nr:protein angel homolog 2-like isoform X1 [Homalodisca vitripennis]